MVNKWKTLLTSERIDFAAITAEDLLLIKHHLSFAGWPDCVSCAYWKFCTRWLGHCWYHRQDLYSNTHKGNSISWFIHVHDWSKPGKLYIDHEQSLFFLRNSRERRETWQRSWKFHSTTVLLHDVENNLAAVNILKYLLLIYNCRINS